MALRIKPLVPLRRSDKSLPNKKHEYDPKLPDPVDHKARAISIRLSDRHLSYLHEIMEALDCDRSEAMRRSIRLLRLAVSGYNGHLHVKDRTGKLTVTPIMNDGVPI